MKAKKKKSTKAAPKKKAKSKAKPKLKAKKASMKTKPKNRAKVAVKKKSTPKKKSKGLSIVELFEMKKEREQAAQNPEAWKHKKDLPPQDQPHVNDLSAKGGSAGKKSGFGGVRHH